MANYTNSSGQIRLGWRTAPVFTPEDPGTPNAIDPDSTNFILASGISDSLQISAIETLVSDLKAYGLWTKMKAIYPFVGGSANSHKFNLKDPRNLDAAYRLVFNGGWTHTNNGAQPNGTTGYADTKLIPSVVISNVDSLSISNYSRTQNTSFSGVQIGCYDGTNGQANELNIYQYYSLISKKGGSIYQYPTEAVLATETNTRGFQVHSRTSSNIFKLFFNNNLLNTNTTLRSASLPIRSLYIGASNWYTGVNQFTPHEHAFDCIGEGLSDNEASNFYTVVQKFQTTLGRHVGTPYVSDPDAIAFLTAAGITDGTQAAAINTLVIRMKADGVWTKMKAIYPFVGGSATSHKFNLKDPRDLDVAYRLVFNGGWIHSSTGALPNGTTGYADTKLKPSTDLNINEGSLGFYSRTNNSGKNSAEIGSITTNPNPEVYFQIHCRMADNRWYVLPNTTGALSHVLTTTDSIGFYQGSRLSSTSIIQFKNNISSTENVPYVSPTTNVLIGARTQNGSPAYYSDRECGFAYIGNSISTLDITNFYNAVQAYQTTLGRQVNIPVVSDSDAQSFLTAANITSYTQASAVNTLVVDLKAAGLWSKMKAIYPFVGGSATSHKFNLKDPRDVDSAFRLTFNGGGTHDSNGYQLNGTNAYANTFFVPNNSFISQNRSSFGVYSRTDSNLSGKIIMGSHGGNGYIYMYLKDGTGQYALNNTNWSSFGGPVSTYVSKKGFFQASRNNSSTTQLWQVDNLNYSSTSNSTGRSTISITIGDCNGLLGGYAENVQVSFSYIGDDLSTTDLSNYYTAVQKFQTSLGRSVNTPVYNNGLVLNLDAGNANSYPGTGTTWFDLASGNNGTLVNGPTYDINNGGSISFDGVNDYVVVSDTPFRFGNQFTINTWIYWDGLDKTNRAILGKRNGPSGNYNQYAMGINNGDVQYGGTGKVLFFYARVDGSTGGNDPLDVSMTYTLPSTPGIYNISVVMNSTIQKMFVNGLLVSTSTKNVSGRTYNISGVDFLVGASRDNTGTGALGFFNNKIYSVSVYGRTLTDSEVLQNFNSTRGRFGL